MSKTIHGRGKKWAVKILAFLFKAGMALAPLFSRGIKIFSHIFRVMGKIIFPFVLTFYNFYRALKKIFKPFLPSIHKKYRLIHFFSRRFITHVSIISLSLFVVTSNLNALEVKRDDLEYSNIFTAIIQEEDLGTLEQDSSAAQIRKVTRYLGTSSVENKPIDDGLGITEIQIGSTQTGALVQPILSPSEAEIRIRDKIVSHTVSEGETISEIAESYGVTVNTLLWSNKMTAYSIIRPGQSLSILPISGVQHTVAKGDTLEKIATRYKVTSEDILEFNKLASADDIQVGEQLIVPGGSPPAPPQRYVVRSFAAPVAQPVTRSGKLTWPATCLRISQYFNSWRHKGVDIACSYGTQVKAAASGTVIKAAGGWNGGYGIMIIIDHGGYETLYGHLSNLYVREGDAIEAGQIIAAMGSTGRSTGPHVHVEYRTGGYQKNPLEFF